MENETYIVGGMVASELPMLEPMVRRIGVVSYPEEDMFGVTPDHVYAAKLLDAAADMYARWFLAMKSAVSRERVRQRLMHEEYGVPSADKVQYQRPCLTAAEESVVALCHDLTRHMFGPTVAEYAMIKFRRAVDTGDKRSFKIRLLVLKSRDALKGTTLYKGFSDGAEECISKAEKAAGCVPDPSPRRMSKAEQARALAKRVEQPTLFDDSDYKQDINSKDIDNCPADGSSAAPPSKAEDSSLSIFSNVSRSLDASLEESRHSSRRVRRKTLSARDKNVQPQKSVTVTHGTKHSVRNNRKTKVYQNVSEISEDIKSGSIVPYSTNDEIVNDIKAGMITPSEAVLFMSELVKRKMDRSTSLISDTVSKHIDNHLIQSSDNVDMRKFKISKCAEDEDDSLDEDDEKPEEVEDGERNWGAWEEGYRFSDAEWRPQDTW